MPQSVENVYYIYAHIPDQSTDAVYSLVREGDPNPTETSHPNTVLPPPTYSSLEATHLQDVNEQGSPEYSIVTQENLTNRVEQTQNSVEYTGVNEGLVYSTVVYQDGEKVTVKMETPRSTEEEDSGAINHGHTSSVEFHSNSHATAEEKRGEHDFDYFDDPDILQQIRAQKQ